MSLTSLLAHAAQEIGGDFRREFCGAVTQFKDGGQVSKVSLPKEYSAARINGLPLHSSRLSIVTLLYNLDLYINLDCVQIPRQDNTDSMSANVTVEDPGFAKSLCTKVKEGNELGPNLSNLRAVQISPRLSANSGARRVECKKVQCSWFKPTRTVWLNFGSAEIVKRVFTKFENKSYKVLGQAVQCNQPTQAVGGWRNPHAWTLILTGLPAAVTTSDIRLAISSGRDYPRHIELGKPSYDEDGEEASAIVISLLSRIGPIEWSQANTQLQGKRAKVVARFYEEVDAREAVQSLDDKSLSFGKNLKLTAQLLSAAKFKVHVSVFHAMQSRIREASDTWQKQHLKLKIYPAAGQGRQYRTVRIEGQVAKDVAAAKVMMDKILDGIKIMDQDTPLWTPALNSNGAAFQRLKQITQDHGAILIRDKRRKELILYSPPEKFRLAESAIVETVRKESSISTSNEISLGPADFHWVIRGGFKMLTSVLGEGIATLDVIAKQISINGSDDDYETSLRMIKNHKVTPIIETKATEDDCPVCLTRAERPIRTACGHVYCMECFEGLCAAAGSDSNVFPITCFGDAGKCQHTFTLEQLQENLSSKAFEDMLESSFISHIYHHPQAFRYCPTPGCNTIYGVDSVITSQTCPGCLTVICTHCHAQHDGLTCAEHKDISSGGYEALQKVKKELGIKDCPKCKTPIEKTEGCNHMNCKGCGAHICWVCLGTFTNSASCYDHMKIAHGDIGLNHLCNI